jgi:nanoRNase/pAp phosphatase (c-di-AMP/oligoRNAs hydrolase)
MSRIHAALRTQSDRLLGVLDEFDDFLIVMHDNPDPDAIASGWGIWVLIQEVLDRPVRLVGGGAIVRAENRHLVELLEPPLELVNDIQVGPRTGTILVDCGSEATNHLLTRKGLRPTAVIDHHLRGRHGSGTGFEDIRPDVAASATLVASYLREQGIEPGAKLAVAMLYAMRTETMGAETHHSELDCSILPWLTERAEPSLLADIENAPLKIDYFGDLLLALQSTFVYDDVAFCFLPRAECAEIVGEVADLLIRGESINKVLCAATVGCDIVLSARTERGSGNAATLLVDTVQGLGGAGGHPHRAGGKIPAVGNATRIEELHDELRRRWLKECGVTRKRGSRLIRRSEIMENL